MTKNDKKRGRPRIFEEDDSCYITFKLDINLRDALEKACKAQRTDKSSYIRGLLVNDELVKKEMEEKKKNDEMG